MFGIQYAPIIPGLEIDGQPAPYPVVNERAIRATAGIMFVIGLSTFLYVQLTRDFTPMYFVVPLFALDFFLKSVFTPRWSIFGFFGRLIVRGQRPEWVGAIQKRFAWSIGLVMALTVLTITVGFGIRGVLPMAFCGVCLTFMWLESSAGICAGCRIYSWLLARGIISMPEYRPACPGGVCSLSKINSD